MAVYCGRYKRHGRNVVAPSRKPLRQRRFGRFNADYSATTRKPSGLHTVVDSVNRIKRTHIPVCNEKAGHRVYLVFAFRDYGLLAVLAYLSAGRS